MTFLCGTGVEGKLCGMALIMRRNFNVPRHRTIDETTFQPGTKLVDRIWMGNSQTVPEVLS